MKKFLKVFYCFLMALLVLSLSGCGSHSKNNNHQATSTQSHLMVLSSPVFEKGGSYKIFRGNRVTVDGTTAKYYVAPYDSGNESVTLNLEFTDDVSIDIPYVITTSDDEAKVLFSYNPSGVSYDTTTASVLRTGGGTQQQKYTSLKLATETDSSVQTSSLGIVDEEITIITLDSSDQSATLSGAYTGTVPTNNFVWHVSPDHANEYWIDEDTSTEYTSESDLPISSTNGIYIANDIRYVPDYLPFSESQTVTKANGNAEGDSDQLYVAYYNTDAEGVDAENTYILAALPTSMGMAQGGGQPGDMGPGGQGGNGEFPGEPPSGEGPGGEPPSFNGAAAETGFSAIVAAMTHSEEEAYNNPVLHITKPGTYQLKGTWDGQIWVDIPDKSVNSSLKTKKDPAAQVLLILDGVSVNCTVAPALVFKKVYECDQLGTYASFDVAQQLLSDDEDVGANAGAIVIINAGTTNTFKGTNVARLNNVEVNDDSDYNDTSLIGKYVKAQDKMYKLDAAFHSRMSMLIAAADNEATGTLNITSDYEGLDSEMHMLIDSGTINVTADDDGINVNEDGVSVFTMDDGTLTINSSGGDGIDSNGYVVINGGTLNITAGQSAQGSAGESGIDCDEDKTYISDNATYNWSQAGTSGGGESGGEEGEEPGGGAGGDAVIEEGVVLNSDNSITVTIPNGAGVVNYQSKAVPLASGDLTDDERAEEGVATESDAFELVNKVNNFSGIRTE